MISYSDAIHFRNSFFGRDLGYHSAKHPERLRFRHRSIADLVSVWDRFEVHLGSVWGPFRVCFGSIMRSGSDSSLRDSRDQVSIPLGPTDLGASLGPHVVHMLAPCWRPSGVLKLPWSFLERSKGYLLPMFDQHGT